MIVVYQEIPNRTRIYVFEPAAPDNWIKCHNKYVNSSEISDEDQSHCARMIAQLEQMTPDWDSDMESPLPEINGRHKVVCFGFFS